MNKGFSLVELIGVIVVLGIIAVITVPAINKTLDNSRNKLKVEQHKTVITAAKQWYIAKNETGEICVTRLQNDHYLDASTNEYINSNDCIVIGKSGYDITYTYKEKCSKC